MTQYSYAREKMGLAMFTLAIGKGDVRSRLRDVYCMIFRLRQNDFPEEYQKDWKWIIKQLTKFGSVKNTLNRIKNTTGEKIAEKVFNIGWGLYTNDRYL